MSDVKRCLIINADDYGLTKDVSRGILEAYQKGIVCSTSIVTNMPAFIESIQLLKRFPEFDCGVHLNLTVGPPISPISEVASLTNADGLFYSLSKFLLRLKLGKVRPREVKREWEAQIIKVQEKGVELSHINSHHHIHAMSELCSITVDLAEEFGIPYMRNPREYRLKLRGVSIQQFLRRVLINLLVSCDNGHHRYSRQLSSADHFTGTFLERLMNNSLAWKRELETIPEGIAEVAVHPGYSSEDLRKLESDKYASQRERELALLIQPVLASLLQENGIMIISYKDYHSWYSSSQASSGG